MNLAAAHDVLNSLSLTAYAAETGDREMAETAYFEASMRSADVFDAGTPQADALDLILGAAHDAVREMAA